MRKQNITMILLLCGVVLIGYGFYQTNSDPIETPIENKNDDLNISEILFNPYLLQDTLRTSFNESIVIENKTDVLVIGCLFDGAELKIVNCTNIRIHTSIFRDVDTAIHIIDSSEIIIEKFAIYNVSYGIIIENSNHIILGESPFTSVGGDTVYSSVIQDWKEAPIYVPGCEDIFILGVDAY